MAFSRMRRGGGGILEAEPMAETREVGNRRAFFQVVKNKKIRLRVTLEIVVIVFSANQFNT